MSALGNLPSSSSLLGATVKVMIKVVPQGLWSVVLLTVYWKSCCNTLILQQSTWNSWNPHPTSQDVVPLRPPPKMSSSSLRWFCRWWRNTSGEVWKWYSLDPLFWPDFFCHQSCQSLSLQMLLMFYVRLTGTSWTLTAPTATTSWLWRWRTTWWAVHPSRRRRWLLHSSVNWPTSCVPRAPALAQTQRWGRYPRHAVKCEGWLL